MQSTSHGAKHVVCALLNMMCFHTSLRRILHLLVCFNDLKFSFDITTTLLSSFNCLLTECFTLWPNQVPLHGPSFRTIASNSHPCFFIIIIIQSLFLMSTLHYNPPRPRPPTYSTVSLLSQLPTACSLWWSLHLIGAHQLLSPGLPPPSALVAMPRLAVDPKLPKLLCSWARESLAQGQVHSKWLDQGLAKVRMLPASLVFTVTGLTLASSGGIGSGNRVT